MPEASKTYHHGDLRNALVEAGLDLIDESGVDAFSLRRAARAVGVTPSATYRHFADREELLAAIAAQGFERLARQMEDAEEAVDESEGLEAERARDKLEALGFAYVAFARANPAQFRLMFGPFGAASAHLPRGTGSAGLDPYELLGRAIDRLVDAEALTPRGREGAELHLWSSVHGIASLSIDGPYRREPDGWKDEAAAAVVRSAVAVLVR